MLAKGKEVKEQIDNKRHLLISYDAFAVATRDHGLALICFFESKLSFYSTSLSFLGIFM
jgi:hypothetical protein